MVIGLVGRPRVGKTLISQLLAVFAAETQGMDVVYIPDSDISWYLEMAGHDLSKVPDDYDDRLAELVQYGGRDDQYRSLFLTPFALKLHIGLIAGHVGNQKETHKVILDSLRLFPDSLVILDLQAKRGFGMYDELMKACNVVIMIGECDNYMYGMLEEYNHIIEKDRVLAYKHMWLINRYDEKMKSVKQFDKIITCGQKPIHTMDYCPAIKRAMLNGDYYMIARLLMNCHPEVESCTKSLIGILQQIYDTDSNKVIKPYGEWK